MIHLSKTIKYFLFFLINLDSIDLPKYINIIIKYFFFTILI